MGILGELLPLICTASGFAGLQIARKKGWPPALGFAVGFFVPALGVCLMALVQNRNAQKGVRRG